MGFRQPDDAFSGRATPFLEVSANISLTLGPHVRDPFRATGTPAVQP